MFEIIYKIVLREYDDFAGQNGFLQIKFNDCYYGEMFPEGLYDIMDNVCLYNWLERFVRVYKHLQTNDYVVLSDVDSFNTWIEFRRKDNEVIVSIVNAEKKDGSKDIELDLVNLVAGRWINQVISYDEFQNEIYIKVGEYIKYITENNKEYDGFDDLMKEYTSIL